MREKTLIVLVMIRSIIKWVMVEQTMVFGDRQSL